MPMTSDTSSKLDVANRHEHMAHHGSHDHGADAGHAQASSKHAPSADSKDIEYTCPMHPQVRQMGPGNCPICGMTLEPVVATTPSGDSPELRDMTRRFWVGLALAIPVFALEMGAHLMDVHHLIGQQTLNWIQLLFGTPVVLWAGVAVLCPSLGVGQEP